MADRLPIGWPIDDPAFKRCPYPHYARRLAAGGQLVDAMLPSGTRAWLTLSYDLGLGLLRDARLAKAPPSDAPGEEAAAGDRRSRARHPLFAHLVTADPPAHGRVRAVLVRALSTCFTPRLAGEVAGIAAALVAVLERAARSAPVDLLDAYAMPLALRTICRIVGVPECDGTKVRAWSLLLNAADFDPGVDADAVADEIDDYLAVQCRLKTEAPAEDALSLLLAAQHAGRLSPEEVRATTFLLLMAGHESSANFVANSVLLMLTTPPWWTRLGSGALAPATAIDELLRFESPVEFATPRFATANLVEGGGRIRAGDLVFVGLSAANRDPARFENPAVLDLRRGRRTKHLAFGSGPHGCPGSAIARLAGEVGLVTLATHLPTLRLACAPQAIEWWPGLIMRGLRRLPVRLGAPG